MEPANFSNNNFSVTGVFTTRNFSDEASQRRDPYIIAAQASISVVLLTVSSFANGLVFFLLVRFKTLQTAHNILVADLAVVDLLNIVINVPLFVCYAVLDLDVFQGRLTAWLLSTLHVLFAYLTLTTMFMMMTDRFMAIRFPFSYRHIKTKKRILVAIFVKWLLSFVAVFSVYGPLYNVNLGDSPVLEYRMTYNRESNAAIPRILAPLVLLGSVFLYLFSWYTLKRHARVNLPRAQHRTGRKRKEKAINTILFIIILFCASFVPEILRSTRPLELVGKAKQWLLFGLSFLIFLPSAVNPFVYFRRVERFRLALKQLMTRRENHESQWRRDNVHVGAVIPLRASFFKFSENLGCSDVTSERTGESSFEGRRINQGMITRRNSEMASITTKLHDSQLTIPLNKRHSV